MTVRSSLFLAALLLATSSPAQTTRPVREEPQRKAYAVRHLFAAGETFLMVVQTESQMITRNQEGQWQSRGRFQGRIDWQVTASRPAEGGAMLVRLKLLRVRGASERQRKTETYDSAEPGTMKPGDHGGLSAMLNAVFTAKLTEDGKIGELTIPDEVLSAAVKIMRVGTTETNGHIRNIIASQVLRVLEILLAYPPPKPASVGQTWTAEVKAPTGGIVTEAQCRLLGVEQTSAGPIATVQFHLYLDMNANGGGPRPTMKGEVRYNVDRQRFVSSKVKISDWLGSPDFRLERTEAIELRDLSAPTTRPSGNKDAEADKP